MANEGPTVIKTGGSNIGLIILAVAIVIAAVVGFMFYQSEQSKDNAITGAASAVGEAAKDVGDAAKPSGN
jgi:predicted membrane-bound mannosyltransferase